MVVVEIFSWLKVGYEKVNGNVLELVMGIGED